MDNDRLTDEEIVNIITEDCISYDYKYFTIEEYNFNGLEINIKIEKSRFTNNFAIKFLTKSYLDNNYSYEFYILNSLEYKLFTDVKDIITFLLKEFRENFMYSKFLDGIYDKTEIEKKEKSAKAYFILCKNKIPDTCCVCLDYNMVITRCNHNLCRICYNNIKKSNIEMVNNDEINYKSCPLCRLSI